MRERGKLVPSSFPVTGGKIAFVGEAPGREEVTKGEPFVGTAGQGFDTMLRDTGILRSECYVGNVFDFQLPHNQVSEICGKKKDMPKGYKLSFVEPASYLPPEYFDCLDRLRDELVALKPNIIVPLGNTALWAVCGAPGIGKFRGTLMESTLVPGAKVIPTYHPQAVNHQWSLRVIVLADLLKIKREAEFPEIRRPDRELWLNPTVQDLYKWETLYLNMGQPVSCDIETARYTHITCVGFASDAAHGIVVPFVDRNKPGYSYWETEEDEYQAWRWIRKILEHDAYGKIFQNGLYDIQWLFRKTGIHMKNVIGDTMVMHHALQPEMPKALDFLGSIYCNDIAWKLIRPKAQHMEKTDD